MLATAALLESLFEVSEIEHLTGETHDTPEYDARVASALRTASGEAEGSLQGVAALPLASVPEALAIKVCHLAHYYLDLDNPTDGAKDRYKAAIRFLERVQDGKASLGLTEAGDAAPVEASVFSDTGESFFDASGF